MLPDSSPLWLFLWDSRKDEEHILLPAGELRFAYLIAMCSTPYAFVPSLSDTEPLCCESCPAEGHPPDCRHLIASTLGLPRQLVFHVMSEMEAPPNPAAEITGSRETEAHGQQDPAYGRDAKEQNGSAPMDDKSLAEGAEQQQSPSPEARLER